MRKIIAALALLALLPTQADARHRHHHRHHHHEARQVVPLPVPRPLVPEVSFAERWAAMAPVRAEEVEFASLVAMPVDTSPRATFKSAKGDPCGEAVVVERQVVWWELLSIPGAALVGCALGLVLLRERRRFDPLMYEDPDDAVRRWRSRVVDADAPPG